jgi:hypothetical protein
MRWLGLVVLSVTFGIGLAACSSSNNESDAGSSSGGCTKSADCGDLVCIGGLCAAPHSVDLGGRCWATRDCSGSGYCDPSGRCSASGSGGAGTACASDGQCLAGYRCDFHGLDASCEQSAAAAMDRGQSCTSQQDCLAGLYCSAAGVCDLFTEAFPRPPGVTCEQDTTYRSYFVVPRGGGALPDFFRLPWPNDGRVTANGDTKTLNMNGFYKPGVTPLGVDLAKIYTEALAADFDGFSTVSPVVFRFSKDIGDAGLDTLRSVITYLDLTTGDSLGAQYAYSPDKTQFVCQNHLSSITGAGPPLKPGHVYAVYFTTALKSAAGDVAVPDPDLAAVLADTKPSDADLARTWDSYAPLRAYFKAHAIAPSTILNATVFTTASPAVHMQRVADAVAKEGVPTITALVQCGMGTDPCTDGTPARACGDVSADYVELHGKLTLPIYQKGDLPYERTGGGLNEAAGVVTKVKPLDVCFALTLPTGTAPGNGWPLVVYGHGTGGSFREPITNGVAPALAKAKIATFAIDEIGHGARANGSKAPPSQLVFNIVNPPAARDGELQGGADVLTALKVARAAAPAGYAGAPLKLDKDKVAYFGHSQGATAGGLALPFTDDTKAVVLGGGGVDLSQSLFYKKSPTDIRVGLQSLIFDDPTSDSAMVLIWQNYFDRVDPINTDGMLVTSPPSGKNPKNVFFVWGTKDTYTPGRTSDSNTGTLAEAAWAMGLSKVGTPLEDFNTSAPTVNRPVSKNVNGVTAAVFQYATGSYDGHFVDSKNADAVKDWTAFLTSYFTTGTATVP